MSPASTALVLASTATHAYWNFLLKRADRRDPGASPVVTALSKVAEVVLFAPAFAWWLRPWDGPGRLAAVLGAWPLVAVGALLTLANYVALSRAYALGDLSLVYPTSRGAGLVLLPPLGYLAFGERLSARGGAGVACIALGVVVLQLPALSRTAVRALARSLCQPAVGYALLAALAAAGYTVWDKRAVRVLAPFAYFYSYTALVGVAFGARLARDRRGRAGAAALGATLRRHWAAVVQVAAGNTGTYVLVLLALRGETSSYVIGLRQLSVVVGVLLGWRLLGETVGPAKRLGVAVITAGCVLVALA